jgi:hypothetical protein
LFHLPSAGAGTVSHLPGFRASKLATGEGEAFWPERLLTGDRQATGRLAG